MATYHIDFVNGNDSNDGSDWANAWLTIDSGATAARTDPGDTIKIAKTADEASLGINATFSDGSATVTLASALTKKIEDATTGGNWTNSTNISSTGSSNRKFGSTSISFTPASGFTTGKVAYATIDGGGTQDFSSYQKICFWFRSSSGTVIADSTYKICLCSDATGDTIVNEINIPATITGTSWRACVLNYGGALSSSVQSVAIYANSDPGTTAFGINNIFAANTLTLDSLIGPSGDCNYCVQSIDGTTLKIDSNNTSATGRGYSGSATTVTLYYQSPFVIPDGSSTWATIQEAGTSTAPYIYSFGWNTSSNLRDGYTVLSTPTVGARSALSFGFKGYLEVSYLKMARFAAAVGSLGSGVTMNNIITCGCSQGMSQAGVSALVIDSCKFLNCSSTTQAYPATIVNTEFRNGTSASFGLGGGVSLFNCTLANNGSGMSFVSYHNYRANSVVLRNCLISDSTEISTTLTALYNSWVTSADHDQTAGNHWMWSYNITANWQTSTFHGSDPGSWKLSTTSNALSSSYPARFPVAKVACNSGDTVTVSVWVLKDHATNIQGKLYVEDEAYTLPGIVAASDTKADDTSWEQLSVTFSATQDGVVPIWFDCWYNGGLSNIYIGSIEISAV